MPNSIFKITAKILSVYSHNIILGSGFLPKHRFHINYEDNFIKINNFEVYFSDINSDTAWKNNPNSKIVTKLLTVEEITPKEEIFRLVEKAKCNNPELGKTSGKPRGIVLTERKPIQAQIYPILVKLKDPVENEIRRLLQMEVIRCSSSNTMVAAFFVIKKDGSIRLVVEYHKLNAITIKASYPFPDPQNGLIELHDKKYFQP